MRDKTAQETVECLPCLSEMSQVSREMPAVHPHLVCMGRQGLHPYWLQLERLKLNLTVARDPELIGR